MNFKDIYDQNEESLLECKVTEQFESPKWMDEKGNFVSNEDELFSFNCKVNITHPDMCLTMDEVGCNLTQEIGGAKGKEKYVCRVDEVPYHSCSTKHSKFTCSGLTTLGRDAVMCVIMIQGKQHDLQTESGIDWILQCSMDDAEFDDIQDGE